MDAMTDAAYERVLDWAGEQGLELYPHQEEAILELLSGNNVVLATPTGSGKSLVATAGRPAECNTDEDRSSNRQREWSGIKLGHHADPGAGVSTESAEDRPQVSTYPVPGGGEHSAATIFDGAG
jgi:hypothetical protein